MARTKDQIKTEITTAFMANESLAVRYGFAVGASFDDVFSIVSFENLIFEVQTFSILFHELIFDNHKKEIDIAIYEQKSGTPRWYRNKVLDFQFGFDLLFDSDKYDNEGYTADQISASKIIKYCSVKESSESNRLTIKVAGESGEDLVPLETIQLTALRQFLSEIKYAGVKINVVNNPADILVLNMQVYRDVKVIDGNGNSILNGGKPVETAIRDYMKALPFDGELVLNDFIDKLRDVDGVDNVNILSATSSAFDPATNSYLDFEPINVKTIPVSGYFKIENFNNISYVV